MLRSHTCGELRSNHLGETVILAAWVNRRRDHGGVTFLDLRDRSGIVQVVANPEISAASHRAAEEVRAEWVVRVEGIVRRRPEGMENPDLPTGEIEVEVHALEVLNPAKTPPFPINEETEVEEMVRLKYRYLDLRRPVMQKNIYIRHKCMQAAREFLNANDFWEIEPPYLVKSTPGCVWQPG